VRRPVALTLLGLYSAMVALVVAWPSPIDRDQETNITRVLGVMHVWGLPRWFDYLALEFTANIGMFVPLAFLLGLALPVRLGWVPILVGPAVSILIEVAQFLLLPERFGTPRDVLSNSIGALVGGLLAIIAHPALDARLARRLA